MILIIALALSLNAQADSISFKGKKAAELYQAINSTSQGQCGNGCMEITELDCSWSNASDSKRFDCHFKDAQGKEHEVSDAKARRLAKAVSSVKKIETSCGAGSCGFRDQQNVKCTEEKTAAKKFKQACTVANHLQSCLSAAKQKELYDLKMRFSATQEANPGCETMRGAGGCLSPRDMIAMQKLEGQEKNGCRAGKAENRDGNDKPSMEAK